LKNKKIQPAGGLNLHMGSKVLHKLADLLTMST